MRADFVVPFWNWVFRHALQVGVRRTVDALRIGERFGEVRLRQAEELFLVESLLLWIWQLASEAQVRSLLERSRRKES